MEKKENFEIRKAPESLTAQDLEKVTGGDNSKDGAIGFCEKDDSKNK